jgi:hypothetical protein
MKLPGEPFNVKLTCPSCGWRFELGLRKVGETEGDDDAFTCCSKCLANIRFDLDGSNAKVLTPDMIARMPAATQVLIHKGHFIAWLAQRASKGMLQ